MSHFTRLPLAAVVSSFFFVACGEDADNNQPPAEMPGTIVDVASGSSDFSTLVGALQAADLVDVLKGTGPFTVFAPTNAAFEALPEGALDALLADPEALAKVLTYHVVPGKVTAAQVVTLDEATTVQGAKVSIRVDGGSVYVGDAKVTTTDLEASNGVIHVIDAVLLPPTVVDLAVKTPDLSTLVTAVTAAGLVETLSGEGPFTIFAPTNAAFDALPEGTLESLLDDVPALTSVLTYHVVSGRYLAADVLAASKLVTVNGAELTVTTSGGAKVDGANIIATDIIGANGVVHLIDAVVLPPQD
ncbi:fasciclin domain-containing protein [Myxococcota bacterium]|nr:fasciclin domain-containing protein [Myxococcota bacterium]